MPTRAQTIADAIAIFESAEYPPGLTPATAWLGIYQTLMWYEPVNWLGFTALPHIIDANQLRPASPQQQRTWTRPNRWQACAMAVAEYLAGQLDCLVSEVPDKVDLLMKHLDYSGMQRQNSLGIAFAGLIKHTLERFGAPALSYETEFYAGPLFAGVSLLGRSTASRGDLIARVDGVPRAIMSAKWSVRHDRVNDVTNECSAYKTAYKTAYLAAQQARGVEVSSSYSLLFYVITNEYDPSRLTKMLNDPCADGVVHVHKAAVTEVCGMNGRLEKLMDIEDLIRATRTWE
jgi:hypothetical protein